MSGLKQLRTRIRSIKSTQKITKAMHVVAAAKLKKVKDKAENLNEFSYILEDIMYDISKRISVMDLSDVDKKFFDENLLGKTHLMVLMTSERGLCGSFNSSSIKKIKLDIDELEKQNKKVKILVVGKKGIDALRNTKYQDMIEQYYNVSKGNYECISLDLKNKIISMVEAGQVGACYIYYNKFKNAMTQVMTREQVLPVERKSSDMGDDSSSTYVSSFEYEGIGTIHEIINLYISGQINYAILQSRASEEGSRMTAMDNATRNAGELIDGLTLKLNRSRQAIITTELTEIISGAEAL